MLTLPRLAMAACVFTAFASAAAAQGPQSDARGSGEVYACINRANGQLRIVLPTESCRQNEVRVQLNVAGNPGPAGPQGEQGEQGAPGGSTSLIVGSGGPEPDLGTTGSIYWDEIGKNLYVKDVDGWNIH